MARSHYGWMLCLVLSLWGCPGDKGDDAVFVDDREGSELKFLSGKDTANRFSFSGDGQKFVYVKTVDHTPRAYKRTMAFQSTPGDAALVLETALTDAVESAVYLSPDGSSIYVKAKVTVEPLERLYYIPYAGGTPVLITEAEKIGPVIFADDSSCLAFNQQNTDHSFSLFVSRLTSPHAYELRSGLEQPRAIKAGYFVYTALASATVGLTAVSRHALSAAQLGSDSALKTAAAAIKDQEVTPWLDSLSVVKFQDLSFGQTNLFYTQPQSLEAGSCFMVPSLGKNTSSYMKLRNELHQIDATTQADAAFEEKSTRQSFNIRQFAVSSSSNFMVSIEDIYYQCSSDTFLFTKVLFVRDGSATPRMFVPVISDNIWTLTETTDICTTSIDTNFLLLDVALNAQASASASTRIQVTGRLLTGESKILLLDLVPGANASTLSLTP